MRMQKLPKSTFLKAFQQLFYFPSVKDGILAQKRCNIYYYWETHFTKMTVIAICSLSGFSYIWERQGNFT